MLRRRSLLLGAAAAVVAVAGCERGGRDGAADVSVLEYPPGHRPAAPRISGTLLSGGGYDVADARGDVVVVNVWASWCGPCRAETADLERVHRATTGTGISFVGLNIRDVRDQATSFVAGRVSYPNIFDPAGRLLLGFTDLPPIPGPPATLIIDRAGDVATVIRRPVGRAELQQLVERIATEGAGGG
jgi:thiol-disulfide isomerase/thioredoxin